LDPFVVVAPVSGDGNFCGEAKATQYSISSVGYRSFFVGRGLVPRLGHPLQVQQKYSVVSMLVFEFIIPFILRRGEAQGHALRFLRRGIRPRPTVFAARPRPRPTVFAAEQGPGLSFKGFLVN